MKRLLCALAWVPALASAAGDGKDFSASLAPGKIHEECQRIEAGQARRYTWKSDQPVDFNVHFHKGDDVSYPVKKDAVRGDAGTFASKAREDYCWMWTAKSAPAKVEGRIER